MGMEVGLAVIGIKTVRISLFLGGAGVFGEVEQDVGVEGVGVKITLGVEGSLWWLFLSGSSM